MTTSPPSVQAGLRALLSRAPVLPVLVVDDAARAVDLAHALVDGGLPVLEVTLRTPAALEVVARIAAAVPAAVVGTGTVCTPDDLRASADAGAQFAVSPGLTPRLLDAAVRGPIPLLPGVGTVSEAMTASDHGFDTLKVFPAGLLGGPALLAAWAGPLPGLRFCPSGGIKAADLSGYLRVNSVISVGGSWVATPASIQAGAWDTIRALALEACAARAVTQ